MATKDSEMSCTLHVQVLKALIMLTKTWFFILQPKSSSTQNEWSSIIDLDCTFSNPPPTPRSKHKHHKRHLREAVA